METRGRFWRKRSAAPDEDAAQMLEESLGATQVLIAQAYAGFNTAADPELVESYVYEIQALQARYSYLLRQRKALESGAEQPAFPAVRQATLPAI
ncbi:MAG: DUF2508 family protein [Pseudoflavonifractor sp.]|nr:DUF2508 family protein [Pseudoflavonifractor sp.]